MQTTEAIRVWLCDCGRIHVEGRHYRRSFTPGEFVELLRAAAADRPARYVPSSRFPHPVQIVTGMRPSAPGGLATEIAKL